jgi:hypothetical protein
MDQRENGKKSDCTTKYRNRGEKKTKTKQNKKTTIARRKRINQDSDGNEERRRCPHLQNIYK